MLVLNYAYPLTDDQRATIEQVVGRPIERVLTIPVQLDVNKPLADQAVALADAAELNPKEWQAGDVLVMLPSLNYAAAGLLAELHGRIGHFPSIVRLRPVVSDVLTRYEVAEIMNLEAIRVASRPRRLDQ